MPVVDDALRQELLIQLRALRRRVDPKLLERVLDAMPGWERCDREATQNTVARFVQNHPQSDRLLAELRRRLAKNTDSE